MGFNIERIKSNAKSHYEVNKWNNVAVVFIVMMLTSLVSGFSSNIDVSELQELVDNSEVDAGVLAAVALAVLGVTSVASMISFIVNIFVVNVLNLGQLSWFHKSIFTDKLDVKVLFEPFRVKYIDNVVTMLLKNIFITLWSMLFVIPGIIKSYSYSMTEFIKAEYPDVKPTQAIDISKKMTEGHKMDLFVLDLNFLGWHLLGVLTCGIVELVYAAPYHNAARAFAYEELKAEAFASGKINEAELLG